jgi:hypothetical protein
MVSFEGEAEDRVVAGSNPALGTTELFRLRGIVVLLLQRKPPKRV